MHKNRFLLSFVAASLTLAAVSLSISSAHADILFGATGTGTGIGTIGTIDTATGAFTSIGAINNASGGNYRVTGLAFNPFTSILYGSANAQSPTSANSLITINTTTGIANFVGSFGLGPVADITFRPDGTLYGWSEGSDDLVTIDTLTGVATVVSNSGLNTYGSGIASNASGTLYYAGDGAGGVFRTIDPTTGLGTTVATLSGGINSGDSVSAMTFDSAGTLFGIEGPIGGVTTYLTSINTTSGAITVIGQSGDRLDAIAAQPSIATAAPEPGSLALLLPIVGGMGMMVRRRRKSGGQQSQG